MGKNKEIFDAEPFAFHRALRIFVERRKMGTSYTSFLDRQQRSSELKRIYVDPDRPPPGP